MATIMKFTHWLNETVIISRMVAVSGDKVALSTVTSAMAQIQPLDGEKLQAIGGVYGKAFRIWVDTDVDIQEGDKLRDENNNYYKVRKGGVTGRAMGSIDYQEIIIEQSK